MIVSIAGLSNAPGNKGDLSVYVDRQQEFSIEATLGSRMDVLHMTLFDTLPPTLAIPDRAEIVVYDTPSLVSSYKATVLADSPSAYWRLDDYTGSLAADFSGNARPATLSGGIVKGVTGAVDDTDTAMKFDGINGIGQVADAAWLHPGNITWEVWVKLTGPNLADYPRVLSYGAVYPGEQLDLQWEPDNYLRAYLTVSPGGANNYLVLGSYLLPPGQWGHIAVVWDGSTGYLYANGQLVGSRAIATLMAAGGPFSFAGASGNKWTAATLDEVAIYPSALSAARILAHYNAGVTRYQSSPVVDPPNAISAYNTWLNGAGSEVISSTPSQWTPRLYGGYAAKPSYAAEGPQRVIHFTAQDYTYRLRSTIVNMAFAAGSTDASIINQLLTRYRSDFDASLVTAVTLNFPAISFPAHSLEQFLQRVIKVSRAFYRVDYFKRLQYGAPGLLTCPINWSDLPDFLTTFTTEELSYQPDGTSLVNKVWVIGGTYLSNSTQYQVPTSAIQNAAYQFALPGDPEPTGMTVSVAGVDQGQVLVAPGSGDPTNQSSFKSNALVQHNPAVVMFKNTPPAASTILVTGRFRYPLIQTVSDPSLIALTAGLIFEGVVRDKRINDLTLAQQVGATYLKNQGQTLKGGSFTSKYRAHPTTRQIVAPGQTATIRNRVIFAGHLKPNSAFTVNLAKDPSLDGAAGTLWNIYNNGPEAATLTQISGDGTAWEGNNYYRVAWLVPNTSTKGIYGVGGTIVWQPNTTYVLSWYARATGGAVGLLMQTAWNTGPSVITALLNPPLSAVWQRYAFRLQWGATVDPNTFFAISATTAGNCALDIDAVQAELGSAVTPFSTGGETNQIIITKTLLKLTDDVSQPMSLVVNYSDRSVAGGY